MGLSTAVLVSHFGETGGVGLRSGESLQNEINHLNTASGAIFLTFSPAWGNLKQRY